MKRVIMCLALAALFVACGKKADKPTEGSAGSAGSAVATGSANPGSGSATGSAQPAGSGSGSGSAVAATVDVPTEMDFEDDATTKITDKNLETEVKALEQQLAEH
jgi:cytoskeletal protein RodZ